jgi:hypothetical protein
VLDFNDSDAIFLSGEAVLDSQRDDLLANGNFELGAVGVDRVSDGLPKRLSGNVLGEKLVDSLNFATLGLSKSYGLCLGGLYGMEAAGLGGLECLLLPRRSGAEFPQTRVAGYDNRARRDQRVPQQARQPVAAVGSPAGEEGWKHQVGGFACDHFSAIECPAGVVLEVVVHRRVPCRIDAFPPPDVG